MIHKLFIAITIVILAGAAWYFVPEMNNNFKRGYENNYTMAPTDDKAKSLIELEQELIIIKGSGEINPVRYDEIDQILSKFEIDGYEIQRTRTLRVVLDSLQIGGESVTVQAILPSPQTSPVNANLIETRPFWRYSPSEEKWKWAREGTPPACPELILPAPVDIDLVERILYPGQVRGDSPKDFKPHGGFQLKAGNVAVELRAPMDGYLTSVAKFTDGFGLHYSLIFQHPCGIQFGGGHWGALPADIQAIMDKVPLKAYGDSRTEEIIPPYFVKKGQVIVTGLQEKVHPDRPGFDWGVADYRSENDASKDPRFQELYGAWRWNTYYGVCWLDWLPSDQMTIVKSFPGADMKSGKYSEYCK